MCSINRYKETQRRRRKTQRAQPVPKQKKEKIEGKGKEKQAKGEVRRVPVRKDGGVARNLSPKVIFKPRTGTLLLTSQTLKHRSV